MIDMRADGEIQSPGERPKFIGYVRQVGPRGGIRLGENLRLIDHRTGSLPATSRRGDRWCWEDTLEDHAPVLRPGSIAPVSGEFIECGPRGGQEGPRKAVIYAGTRLPPPSNEGRCWKYHSRLMVERSNS